MRPTFERLAGKQASMTSFPWLSGVRVMLSFKIPLCIRMFTFQTTNITCIYYPQLKKKTHGLLDSFVIQMTKDRPVLEHPYQSQTSGGGKLNR